ncbi:MAG: universal stress protein [Desulfobacteraceae bacterium]|nr:universal stress protein [Desulfobacteraceae bacterium]
MERKILVAVDGSSHSHNILRYLGLLFRSVPGCTFHLLCIVPGGPLPEAGQEWLDEPDLLNAMSSEGRHRYQAAKRYMGEAILQLARRGIDPAQVTTEVRPARAGIAGDILHEARKGLYDALLIGRRGLSNLEKVLMGSISSTLLAKSRDIPVWMVDGVVRSAKILVPVDGSPHCLRAVDHLAFILRGNPHAEVTLFHSSAMLARRGVRDIHDFKEQWGEEWCELHLSRPDSLFHAPEQVLRESGFPDERLHRLHTHRGLYPSRQILRQALVNDFGTIVIGRRGAEIPKGMLKGVSDQVVAMAEGLAVWVLG